MKCEFITNWLLQRIFAKTKKTQKTTTTKQKQEPDGPHHSPEKPVQINTFERSSDNINYKTGPEVQEERIFKFREITFAILLLSPNIKRYGLSI